MASGSKADWLISLLRPLSATTLFWWTLTSLNRKVLQCLEELATALSQLSYRFSTLHNLFSWTALDLDLLWPHNCVSSLGFLLYPIFWVGEPESVSVFLSHHTIRRHAEQSTPSAAATFWLVTCRYHLWRGRRKLVLFGNLCFQL